MDRLFKHKRSCFGVVFLVLFATNSNAATHWVSPTGGATWAASESATPLSGTACTTYQLAMANADDDDIVNFRVGTYVLDLQTPLSNGNRANMRPTNSGSLGHVITFQAYNQEQVILDNYTNNHLVHTSTLPTFGSYVTSYHVWDGFTTTQLARDTTSGLAKAAAFDGADSVVIKNCVLAGDPIGKSNSSSIRLEDCDGIQIVNNLLYNNGRSGTDPTNPSGVEIYDSSNVTVEKNTMHTSCNGVYMKSGTSNNITVQDNYFYNCNKAISILSKWDTPGTNDDDFYENHIYRRNVARNCSDGFISTPGGDGQYGAWSIGLMFYNNTSYAENGYNTSIYHIGRKHTQWFNNIVYTTSSNKYVNMSEDADSISYANYNLYFGSTANPMFLFLFEGGTVENYANITAWKTHATGWESASEVSNPNFLNGSGALNTVEDFKLQTSSPTLAKTGGRGGAYPAYLGAWEWPINESQQIGYVVSGETGDITAPTVISVAVNTSTATITFDEDIVSTGYDASDFDLDCSTTGNDLVLTSPSGLGSSRTFTVASPIVFGETCSLDYVGTTDDIEDTSGNDLAVFSNAEVTNDTPDPGDTTDPVISNGLPSGVQSCASDPRNIDMSVTTDENTDCRYGLSGTIWDNMSVFSTTGETSHSVTISSLDCGESYSYDVICQDPSSNESLPADIDFSISAQSVIKTIEGCGFSGADID